MRLKICDSHLTCKVANKRLNVRERVEVVEWINWWSPPFPCCPVSRQCLWKKILIEKKKTSHNSWQNSCKPLLLVLVRIGLFRRLQVCWCFCRTDFKSVFKCFHRDAVFNWSCNDEHPTNVLKMITQHKW